MKSFAPTLPKAAVSTSGSHQPPARVPASLGPSGGGMRTRGEDVAALADVQRALDSELFRHEGVLQVYTLMKHVVLSHMHKNELPSMLARRDIYAEAVKVYTNYHHPLKKELNDAIVAVLPDVADAVIVVAREYFRLVYAARYPPKLWDTRIFMSYEDLLCGLTTRLAESAHVQNGSFFGATALNQELVLRDAFRVALSADAFKMTVPRRRPAPPPPPPPAQPQPPASKSSSLAQAEAALLQLQRLQAQAAQAPARSKASIGSVSQQQQQQLKQQQKQLQQRVAASVRTTDAPKDETVALELLLPNALSQSAEGQGHITELRSDDGASSNGELDALEPPTEHDSASQIIVSTAPRKSHDVVLPAVAQAQPTPAPAARSTVLPAAPLVFPSPSVAPAPALDAARKKEPQSAEPVAPPVATIPAAAAAAAADDSTRGQNATSHVQTKPRDADAEIAQHFPETQDLTIVLPVGYSTAYEHVPPPQQLPLPLKQQQQQQGDSQSVVSVLLKQATPKAPASRTPDAAAPSGLVAEVPPAPIQAAADTAVETAGTSAAAATSRVTSAVRSTSSSRGPGLRYKSRAAVLQSVTTTPPLAVPESMPPA
jgi:hypothetical protein